MHKILISLIFIWQNLVADYKKAILVVTKEWLRFCYAERRLVPVEPYIVPPQSGVQSAVLAGDKHDQEKVVYNPYLTYIQSEESQ